LESAKAINEHNKGKEHHSVEEIDENVVKNLARFAISEVAA
jgi:hypothetical protein